MHVLVYESAWTLRVCVCVRVHVCVAVHALVYEASTWILTVREYTLPYGCTLVHTCAQMLNEMTWRS